MFALLWWHIAVTCQVHLPVEDDLFQAVKTARRLERRLLMVVAEGGESGEQAGRLFSHLGLPPIRRRVLAEYLVVSVKDRSKVAELAEAARAGGWPAGWHTWESRLLPGPCLAVVDFTDGTSPRYGEIDFVAPLDRADVVSSASLATIVTLPSGTWTQRLMVYAVRMHSDRPRSADAAQLPLLVEAAEAHSVHQASIPLQGHHGWEDRFQMLLRRLPGGLVPYEVCAESWPGENAFEAALECVRSWRQSEGHWRLVSSANRFYAFDMARGANGVWYGTGLFAMPREEAR